MRGVWSICRFASLLDSLTGGFVDDPRFVPILERDLIDGQHRNATGNSLYFTTAYFHRPDEVRVEIRQAGLEHLETLALDGPVWLAKDFDERWADPVRREQLLALARQVEREPELMGVSQHLLAVARKW